MKKRIISLLMALLMLTSLLPTAVWAEGDTPEQAAAAATDSGTVEQEQEQEPAAPETSETPVEPEQPTEPEQSTEPKAAAEPEADAEPDSNGIALYSTASGQCGNNLTWTLDNGVLTISGKGAMWDRDNEWYGFGDVLSIDQADEVTSVVVKSGVTSIACEAFNWLENMTSVTIPKTVTSIGCNAFMRDCDALTTINYAGTTSQWKSYFGSTLSLPLATKVVCSNGTVTPALSGKCGKNVSYSISDDGVLTISGTGAMNNFTYKSDDSSDCPWHGVRYALKKIVVEDGVTSIGSCAFSFDAYVTDVTLPSSLKTIGNGAFLGCHGLTSVVIPEGVTSVGAYAFEWCTSIETITVPASTTKFGDRAFITWEYYSDDDYYMALTDIYYGGSRQQWYDAGGGNAAPMVVTIHYNGATGNIIDSGTCGDNAFWKLDKDYTLTISGTGAMWDYPTSEDDSWWMDWALPWKSYEAISRIVVAEGITHIGAYAFYCTDNATALSLPSSLISIGRAALCGFGGTEIIVPDNVTCIDNFAFNGCDNLKTVSLPAGLQNIGICFIECDALKTINFGGTMEQWLACGGGQSTFPTTTSVVCQGGGTLYRSGTCGDNLTWDLDNNGNLIILGTGDMYDLAYDDESGSYTLPWVEYRSMIRRVEIGSGVTRIGAWAFEDTNITSLTIPGSVTAIGDYGVSNRYLAELTLNEGLRSIGKGAFSGNKRLTTLTIPDGVTTIGEEAFAHCWTQLPKSDSFTGLTTVTIPGSVTSIGKNAFTDNQQLTTVNFGGTQEQWNAAGGKNAGVPSSATFHCVKVVANGKCGTGVKWSLASNGVLTITGTGKGVMTDYAEGSTKPWESKGDVKQIIICEGVTHIGDHAFANSPATRVSLPESLTSIGTRAFAGAAITAMTIPGSVTTIGVEVFWGCSELTSLTICDGVTAIESAFGKCTGLTELVLPDSVTTIGAQAFDGCTGLEEITFSRNLTSIGYMAFSGCTGLTELVFPDSLKKIGQESFKYCSGLRAVSLGTGLTTIGRMAFDGCDPTAVDYRGTQKEWRSIAIGNKNDCLSRVTCIKLGVIVTDGDTPDVKDVASLYDHLTGQADTAYTPQQELSADVNRDGTLDVYDLQLLYEAVAQGTEL